MNKKVKVIFFSLFSSVVVGISLFGIYQKVSANTYTPWRIQSVSKPQCESYWYHGARKSSLVQYQNWIRYRMNGRTGQRSVEQKTTKVVLGLGQGAGCP